MSTEHVAVDRSAPNPAAPDAESTALAFHHVGVQTADFDTSVAWYTDFFQARVSWTLDTFAPLTLSRLPGLDKIAELVSGGLRFHLLARDGVVAGARGAEELQYQHVCIVVSSPQELSVLRDRWYAVAHRGRYGFGPEAVPTEIVVDAEGIESFYCLDPNGLEYEFTYVPGAVT